TDWHRSLSGEKSGSLRYSGLLLTGVQNVRCWSRGRLLDLGRCPACGATSSADAKFIRKDDQGLMPDLWKMVKCSGCRSIYLDPRPSPDSIGEAYSDYYTHVPVVESTGRGLVWSLVNG